MAINRGIQVDGQAIPNATGTLYDPTTNGATRGVIVSVSVFATSAATLVMYVVPDGGTAGADNQTVTRAMAAGETYTAPELIGQGIKTGGVLQGNDSAAGGAALNIVMTVTEFTGTS